MTNLIYQYVTERITFLAPPKRLHCQKSTVLWIILFTKPSLIWYKATAKHTPWTNCLWNNLANYTMCKWGRLCCFSLQRKLVIMLYFDLRPGLKMLFQGDAPEGSDTFQWPVIERDRVGRLRLIIWDKRKVPRYHYSDAPEEGNLWTAWQLFSLDDD